jgi:hypothetical protein
MLRPSLWFATGQNTILRPSLWFVTGQNAVGYDQVYDLLLVRTLYVTTKLMSPGPVACFSDEDDVSGNQNNCYWPLHSEYHTVFWPVTNHKLGPSLWFVTGQNAVCYDQVYDLLLVRTLYYICNYYLS